MKEFDLEAAKNGAPVQTRNGRPARIVCWDRKDTHYPIVVLCADGDKEWIGAYTQDGKYDIEGKCPLDLFMVPTKKEGWINIYPNNLACGVHNTQEEADKNASKNRVACVHIEWEE